jgi:hypothetical protein
VPLEAGKSITTMVSFIIFEQGQSHGFPEKIKHISNFEHQQSAESS